MAVTVAAAAHHTTCALPRRRHAASTSRRRAPSRSGSGSGRLSTTSLPSPAAAAPAPPPATLDRVLSDLESNPRLLTPSLLAALLSALPRHPSPRRSLARLRRVLPASLLRCHPGLAVRLLHLHASLGLVAYAHHLFDHLLPPRAREGDAFPWNCLVAGYARLGRHDNALALYLQMDEDGVLRDRFTFASALEACAGAGSVALGQALHRDAVRAGLAADVLVCDALVDMYVQCSLQV